MNILKYKVTKMKFSSVCIKRDFKNPRGILSRFVLENFKILLSSFPFDVHFHSLGVYSTSPYGILEKLRQSKIAVKQPVNFSILLLWARFKGTI